MAVLSKSKPKRFNWVWYGGVGVRKGVATFGVPRSWGTGFMSKPLCVGIGHVQHVSAYVMRTSLFST